MALTANAAARSMLGRDLLEFSNYTADDILALLVLAADLKKRRAQGDRPALLAGKTLGMIFEKASTRTRVSFEVAMFELGGHALFLSDGATQIGRGEPVADTARVLSRYVDGIMVRTFAHAKLAQLALHASVPVINGLTDAHHPCQALADLLTIQEVFGDLRGLTLAYVGDGNNMLHSLMQAGALVGMNVRSATPKGYEPDAGVTGQAAAWAKAAGGSVAAGYDPFAAVAGADVVYTDVWASMGQEAEAEARQSAFAGYQVDAALLAAAAGRAIFMHCLPAHRGEEVNADVIDGPQSVVFDQAENRLHAQKAVLVATMGAGMR